MEWQPIETAPYGVIVEVKNGMMEKPVLATRGYVFNGAVHKDQTFFTTVFTPDRFFPITAGHLVCPTEWRHVDPPTEP